MMEPMILCWDYLLLSIVVAPLFSLGSAQFANKVKGKTVGYATGAILLALGLSMIVGNDLEKIKAIL